MEWGSEKPASPPGRVVKEDAGGVGQPRWRMTRETGGKGQTPYAPRRGGAGGVVEGFVEGLDGIALGVTVGVSGTGGGDAGMRIGDVRMTGCCGFRCIGVGCCGFRSAGIGCCCGFRNVGVEGVDC